MGCDIHAYLEAVHTDDKGQRSGWCFAELTIDRDYALFGMLANVRWVNPLGFQPKGMPPRGELSHTVLDAYYERVDDEKAKQPTNQCDECEREKYITREAAMKYGRKILIGETREDGYKYDDLTPGCDWHSASYLNLEELMVVRNNYKNFVDPGSSMWRPLQPRENPEEALKKAKAWNRELIKMFPEDTGRRVKQRIALDFTGGLNLVTTIGGGKKLGLNSEIEAIIGAMKGINRKPNTEARLVFWFDN